MEFLSCGKNTVPNTVGILLCLPSCAALLRLRCQIYALNQIPIPSLWRVTLRMYCGINQKFPSCFQDCIVVVVFVLNWEMSAGGCCALLYTGRGTSQLCLAETKKALAQLDIHTAELSDIKGLAGAGPPQPIASSFLGKFSSSCELTIIHTVYGRYLPNHLAECSPTLRYWYYGTVSYGTVPTYLRAATVWYLL